MVLLQAEDLWVQGPLDGKRQALLRSIHIDIEADRFTVLLGESGAGKTILARAISGLLPAGFVVQRGSIRFRGRQLSTPACWRDIRGRKIFYCPQNAAASLNPVLTIGRQIRESSRICDADLLAMLAGMLFTDPERVLNSYPFMLSGGENQRCLLAMALASCAELLILDEPTAELDAAAQAEFVQALRTCQSRYGPTFLLLSHQLELIEAVGQYLYVLRDGEIVAAGTPQSVLGAPCHPYTREIAAYLKGG